jgi:hypothetical protein
METRESRQKIRFHSSSLRKETREAKVRIGDLRKNLHIVVRDLLEKNQFWRDSDR